MSIVFFVILPFVAYHFFFLFILFLNIFFLIVLVGLLDFILFCDCMDLLIFLEMLLCLFGLLLGLLNKLVIFIQPKRILDVSLLVLSRFVEMVGRSGEVTHQVGSCLLGLVLLMVVMRRMVRIVRMVRMSFIVRNRLRSFVFLGRRRGSSRRCWGQLFRLFFFFHLLILRQYLSYLFLVFFLFGWRRGYNLFLLSLLWFFLHLLFPIIFEILFSFSHFLRFILLLPPFDLALFLILFLFLHVLFLLNSLEGLSLVTP